MKQNPLSITIGIVLVIIFGLWLFVFQVRETQVALVTTFGKPTAAPITQPGAYFKWPWPVQRVHKFDRRIQNFEDKLDETYTVDGFTLVGTIYVGWQIKDPVAFYPKFASGTISESETNSIAQAERALAGLLRSAKSAVIGRHALSDFVSTDPNQLKFEAVEAEILTNIDAQVKTNNYGIEVKYLGFKKLGFPESVTQEVFKRMTSERMKRIITIKSTGEKDAMAIRSRADSTSAEILANANAEATRIRGEGQAEAAKYYSVFEKNRELAIFLLNLDAMEQSLKTRATLIFDNHTQPFNYFQGFSTNLSGRK